MLTSRTRRAGQADAEVVEISVANAALNVLTNYVNNVAQTRWISPGRTEARRLTPHPLPAASRAGGSARENTMPPSPCQIAFTSVVAA